MKSFVCIDRRRFLHALGVPAAALVLTACGSQPHSAGADPALLLQRARDYWALVKANDKLAAWPYEFASKDPKASIEGYIKKGGVVYHAVEVRGVRELEGDRAVLDVWFEYSVPAVRLRNQKAAAEDHWRLLDGVWYHAPPRSLLMPD